MSKIRPSACLCALALAAAAASVARAELQAPALSLDSTVLTLDAAPATAPASAPAPQTDWTDALKKPAPWISWGADERMRIEYANNNITLNENGAGHEQDYFRYRSRLWTSITPCAEFTFNARLIWEGRYYMNPQPPKWNNGQAEFDNLNFKLNLVPLATTVTVGRQDIVNLGDGWLVLDGTPADGSTTLYFDAVRSTTNLKDIQTTVDVIAINQYASPDHWMPSLGDTDRLLIENNERGAILWIANKSIKNLEIDPYFIYKHDQAVLSLAKGGDNADIYTFGTRLVETFNANLAAHFEAAGQFGDKNGTALGALGVKSFLDYNFNDAMKNELRFNFEYLSGDPRRGNNNEDKAFDPLWGRYPQFSELIANTDKNETRGGNTTNLLRFGPSYMVRPTAAAEIQLDYNALFANQNTLADAGRGFSEGGNFRGHLFSAIFRYKFNSHLAGHLWGEYLIPGNYYDEAHRDNAMFLRAEVVLTF